MGNFKNLNVWKDAMDIVTEIYGLTSNEKFSKDFGLKNQIQRCAVSIPSNIAEGEESLTQKIAIKHFTIAKASAAELITQLIIADRIKYIEAETRKQLERKIESIGARLNKLIQYRQSLIKK